MILANVCCIIYFVNTNNVLRREPVADEPSSESSRERFAGDTGRGAGTRPGQLLLHRPREAGTAGHWAAVPHGHW